MTGNETTEATVYISCVEDVRYSFASHLSDALRGIQGIDVFVDSDLLTNEAKPKEKLEKARVYVMVLPGNGEPIQTCLDKLMRNDHKVVIPVLYRIGTILEEKWRCALQDIPGLSPFDQSRKECTDSELVDDIVKDVYEKLFNMERIGIYSKLLEIENMVCKQPLIRSVGIWGMPGIGKTTLAKAVFDQMSGAFDAHCFIKDFDKSIREKGLNRLLEEQFLKEKPGAGRTIPKLSLLRDNLRHKRVLVVLDDVRNPLLAESFLGGSNWFGHKSLIIITSRDKQVYRLCRVNKIYEVQGLNVKEALQLFSLHASINDMAEQDCKNLSMKVIKYANGNPLALHVYGKELKGKREPSEMETAFLNIKQRPPSEIIGAFKSSYETLSDSEKSIFLDIACFFQGEPVDYVMHLLEGCGFFPHIGIDVLVEKCLVTVSENRVWMQNLIQDFGREIIYGETEQIERRSRLWEPSSIEYILEDNEQKANVEPKTTIKHAQGTEEIEGMFLDASGLSYDVKPSAFQNMVNLRLLKIYYSAPETHNVLNFPKGINFLPNELRLLHWENYPLQYLPPSFDPMHLVEINMPYSQLQKLWGGTKTLETLRTIRLCHSQQLVDIQDISKAENLEVVELQGCTKLQSLPDTGKLLNLRAVNLSGCTMIERSPEVSPNIEALHLQGTGIVELSFVNPNGRDQLVDFSKFEGLSDVLKLRHLKSLMKSFSSSQHLGKLVCLDLKDCSHLQSLPDMVDFESLKVLVLSGCSDLKIIKDFPRNLKELYVAFTAVRTLPELPKSLELLDAHGCNSLEYILLDPEMIPMHYEFSNCFNLSPQVVNVFLLKVLAHVKRMARDYHQELNKALPFSFCAPSQSKKYATFDLQPGSSVMIQLYPSWTSTLLGFSMLVEVAFPEDYCDATGFSISCVCRWKNKEGRSSRIERNLLCWAPGKAVQKDHMFAFCDVNMRPSTDEGKDPDIWADLVVFEFFLLDNQKKPLGASYTVKGCGVSAIDAATGNKTLESISPVLSQGPMKVYGDKVEASRVRYDGLQEIDRALFLYIACLFNDEDLGFVAPLITNFDLDVSSGLKALANRSLISVSSSEEIVMHHLLRDLGKEILHAKSNLVPTNILKSSHTASAYMGVTQPQVFINFQGQDVSNDFVDSLIHEMKNEKLNVFIDKKAVRGMDLQDLLVKIEESTVAIVIFSKNYTNSDWCLNELARIYDCVERGTLMAIPIFYKIEPWVVKGLDGDFGFAFRTLKFKNQHDPVTEKWERAIASISRKSGIELREHGLITDRTFRADMIVEVKKWLDHIRKKKADQERQTKTIQNLQPEVVQIRQSHEAVLNKQPEKLQIQQPVITPQGCTFKVENLKISGWHNARYWTAVSISESTSEEAIEVAKMRDCYYLEVKGTFDTVNLTAGTRYEVVFVVKIEDTMSIWDNPAKVQLMVPGKNLQERELQFFDLEKNKWVEIQAGVFDARPHKAQTEFYLYQYDSKKKKTGIVVKSAILRPMK